MNHESDLIQSAENDWIYNSFMQFKMAATVCFRKPWNEKDDFIFQSKTEMKGGDLGFNSDAFWTLWEMKFLLKFLWWTDLLQHQKHLSKLKTLFKNAWRERLSAANIKSELKIYINCHFVVKK